MEKSGSWRNIQGSVLLSALLVTLAIGAHTLAILNDSWSAAKHFQKFRDVYIVTSTLGFALLNRKRLSFGSELKPFAVFVAYVFTILVAHSLFEYAGMWGLWILYLGMFFPSSVWLESREQTANFVGLVLSALVLLLVWVYFKADSLGVDLEWQSRDRVRLTGGLSNPVPFAKLVATVFWLSILQAILTGRKLYLVVTFLSLVVLSQSDVRAELVGVVVGLVTYVGYQLRLRALKWFVFSLVGMFVVVAIVWVDYDKLDSFSSGRLKLWEWLIAETYDEAGFEVYLFGSGRNIEGHTHYDSLYLETLLRYGIIGGIFLFQALVFSLRELGQWVFVLTKGYSRQLASWSVAVFAALCASGLFNVEFPSLGNSLNILLLPMAFAISRQIRTVVEGDT